MDQQTKDRQKFVLSELQKCNRYSAIKHLDEAPDTPEVRKARRIIAAHEKRIQTISKRAERKFDQTYASIRREVYFGSLVKALKMVEQFQKAVN